MGALVFYAGSSQDYAAKDVPFFVFFSLIEIQATCGVGKGGEHRLASCSLTSCASAVRGRVCLDSDATSRCELPVAREVETTREADLVNTSWRCIEGSRVVKGLAM